MMSSFVVVALLMYVLLIMRFSETPFYKKFPLNYILLFIYVASMNCILVSAAYRIGDIMCLLIPSIVLMAYVIMNYIWGHILIYKITRFIMGDGHREAIQRI